MTLPPAAGSVHSRLPLPSASSPLRALEFMHGLPMILSAVGLARVHGRGPPPFVDRYACCRPARLAVKRRSPCVCSCWGCILYPVGVCGVSCGLPTPASGLRPTCSFIAFLCACLPLRSVAGANPHDAAAAALHQGALYGPGRDAHLLPHRDRARRRDGAFLSSQLSCLWFWILVVCWDSVPLLNVLLTSLLFVVFGDRRSSTCRTCSRPSTACCRSSRSRRARRCAPSLPLPHSTLV